MSDAREEILGRVRAALSDRPDVPEHRSGPPRAGAPGRDLVARFVQRVEDYRATVVRVDGADPDVVRTAIETALARHDAHTVALPAGFPAAWRPASVTLDEAPADALPDPHALARLDGVVTTSAAAIAETGTIILDAGPGQGPRALSLIPDVHVCVVRASQIVSGVVGAVAEMRRSVTATRRPLTLISGPSATSDIELDRVEGVHGPRLLEVVVVDDAGPEPRTP
ncbi:MAG: lactate utilization protein [Conexibacter sp.]|jgi:L-lactate dehydrogenase complex protein LldG|nr:lactate utilization protein [Conexibacter sp.]MCZ4494313.1 lactate utilization protein [Conexibacter sp.]